MCQGNPNLNAVLDVLPSKIQPDNFIFSSSSSSFNSNSQKSYALPCGACRQVLREVKNAFTCCLPPKKTIKLLFLNRFSFIQKSKRFYVPVKFPPPSCILFIPSGTSTCNPWFSSDFPEASAGLLQQLRNADLCLN